MSSDYAAAPELARFLIRRDRLRMAIWIAGIVMLIVTTAASTKSLYDTPEALRSAAALDAENPAALALNGPDLALDTIEGQIIFQIGAFGLLMVGLMAIMLTGRVTRGEEDAGRLELVRAQPVGRHAPLAAGLGSVVCALVVLGAAASLALVSQGLPARGAAVFGTSYLGFGAMFAAITALAAQVSENPRVTTGTAGGLLGVAFGLRALGDVGDGTLSWLSPMGWAQRSAPYAGDRWWPVLLLFAAAAGLAAAARAVTERRDFGSGLVAPRPGRARGAPSLASPVGLAVRMHRAAIAWWLVGVVSLGAVYGSLASSIDDFVADNESIRELLAGFGDASLTDTYLATSLLTVALLAAGVGLQVALRLRTEEGAQRAEQILATPVSRGAWLASHTGVALAASVLALVAGGTGVGVAYASTGGGWNEVPRLAGAALAHAPAVAVLVGAAVALFGRAPRWAMAAWGLYAWCSTVAMFGPLLGLPQWVDDLSPLQHTPPLPASTLEPVPVAVLAAVAAGLVAVGMTGFSRRDVTAGS